MTKNELKIDDLVEFANGKKVMLGVNIQWVIRDFYTNDLKCKTNSDFDIVKVYRPTYEVVYERNERER